MKRIISINVILSICCVASIVLSACSEGGNFMGLGDMGAAGIPNIEGVSPFAGSPGDEIELNITNYRDDYKVVFGTSAVNMVDAGLPSISAQLAGQMKAKGIATGEYKIVVPSVGAGRTEIFITNGIAQSNTISFNVVGSASPSPNSSGNVPNDQPPGGLPPGGLPPEESPDPEVSLEVCYCDYTNSEIPDELKCDGSVSVCPASDTGIYRGAAVLTWDIAHVKSAFISIDQDDLECYEDDNEKIHKKPFSYLDFIGDIEMPYLGKQASSTINSGIVLLEDPLEKFESLPASIKQTIDSGPTLPFNYCLLYPVDGSTAQKDAVRCFDSQKAGVPYKVNIFIPLVVGEDSKSGVWPFRLSHRATDAVNHYGTGSTFTLYYKSWADEILEKQAIFPAINK